VPDDAIQVTGNTLTLNLQNVAVVDQLQFPGGTGNIPATFTYTATYVKSGAAREVVPKSHDPLSPFNWAGKMWNATNTGTFAVAYTDGSFSATGSFNSTGNFGEMGTERNGRFVEHEGDSKQANVLASQEQSLAARSVAPPTDVAMLKGRVPLSALRRSALRHSTSAKP
jgi:hypothetical protein